MKPLQPRAAYFGGRVNAAKLYHKCEGLQAIHYMDAIRMFPFVMLDPKYPYPTDKVFSVMKVLIEAPNDLYLTLLPDFALNGKVMYVLKTMTGMEPFSDSESCSFRIQNFEIYEQHHFP